MVRKRPFFLYSFSTIDLHRKFCFGLTGSLIKIQRAVFLVKMLHILPRVVQRHCALHQVRVKKMNKQINKQIKNVNDVQQEISFTLEAVPAECHRSGRWKMLISGLSARWQEGQFWQTSQNLSVPWNLKSFKEWAPSFLLKMWGGSHFFLCP